MWSVVVFPLVFIRIGIFSKSFPSQAAQGFITCIRSLSSATTTWILLPSSGGGSYAALPDSKSLAGTSGAGLGGCSLNSFPSEAIKASVSGLKESRPAAANAVTISGLPIKFIVVGWPSFLLGKFLLYEVTIVLDCSVSWLALRHWPIQGPQAFARTVAFILCRESIWPSRSIVALTFSEPGVTMKGISNCIPCAFIWSATSAARLMSS